MNTANAYALPDGSIINLPDHCREWKETFQMHGGEVVYAVRVITSRENAIALAKTMPRPRKVTA